MIIFTHKKNSNSLFKASTSITLPFFPTQKHASNESMQALLTGKLRLEGRCLKVEGNLIIWPYGYSVKTEGDKIKIYNDKGRLVAAAGDSIKLAGGQVSTGANASAELSKFTKGDCQGPLWITGQVLSSKR